MGNNQCCRPRLRLLRLQSRVRRSGFGLGLLTLSRRFLFSDSFLFSGTHVPSHLCLGPCKVQVAQLQKHVQAGHAVSLVGAPHKPAHGSKRKACKNQFSNYATATSGKKRQARAPQQEKRRRQKKRAPRAMKTQAAATRQYTAKEIAAAYNRLLSTRWAWKRTTCPCGGNLVKVKKKTAAQRGSGRAFQRCSRCKKWYDVLATSHLPVVKAPLPVVVSILEYYFASIGCPTPNQIGTHLGLSCDGVVRKLVRVLRSAEVRCAQQRQIGRELAGHCKCLPSTLNPEPLNGLLKLFVL